MRSTTQQTLKFIDRRLSTFPVINSTLVYPCRTYRFPLLSKIRICIDIFKELCTVLWHWILPASLYGFPTKSSAPALLHGVINYMLSFVASI